MTIRGWAGELATDCRRKAGEELTIRGRAGELATDHHRKAGEALTPQSASIGKSPFQRPDVGFVVTPPCSLHATESKHGVRWPCMAFANGEKIRTFAQPVPTERDGYEL